MIDNKNEEKSEILAKNRLELDIQGLVLNMVKELPDRARDIITKRFNLDGKGIKTLDEIGKEYGITRERVRQIEAESIQRLKEVGSKHNINQVLDFIKQTIEGNGGIKSEDKVVDLLFDKKGDANLNKQITLLVLSLDENIRKAKETKAYKKIYFYQEGNVAKLKEVIDKLDRYFQNNKQSVNFGKIIEIVNADSSSSLPENVIKSYLDANKVILGNILGQWGHEKWPDINPKSARDKAYLALKESTKPLHFVEITDRINQIWQGKKKANSQTVHNELIKDNRFVLVGRGIYALREWGYSPGTVLDVIIEVMKTSKAEMSQDEIIQEVLKKRQVKKNTIVLNLQDKDYFEKLPNKVYKLKASQV